MQVVDLKEMEIRHTDSSTLCAAVGELCPNHNAIVLVLGRRENAVLALALGLLTGKIAPEKWLETIAEAGGVVDLDLPQAREVAMAMALVLGKASVRLLLCELERGGATVLETTVAEMRELVQSELRDNARNN